MNGPAVADYVEDSTILLPFTTHSGTGGAAAPSSAFEAADVKIYKGSSATEKTTTNGLTMTSPFDSITGLHLLAIDTSVDTGDTGFWEKGQLYWVVLSPDETVDGEAIVSVIGMFWLEMPGGPLDRLRDGVVDGVATTGGTTTSVPTSSLVPAAVATDQFKGRVIIFNRDTTTAALRGQGAPIDGSTSGGTITIAAGNALTSAPASGDTFRIY